MTFKVTCSGGIGQFSSYLVTRSVRGRELLLQNDDGTLVVQKITPADAENLQNQTSVRFELMNGSEQTVTRAVGNAAMNIAARRMAGGTNVIIAKQATNALGRCELRNARLSQH